MGDKAAIKTYRFLRISVVGVVGLLAASVAFERTRANCWQPSISAYYYTPVRVIFVGGLMAIGLSLIVMKGSTPLEDACLNVAGMLAAVVAVVPTSDTGACWSVQPRPLPVNPDGSLAAWVVANIDNNVESLLFAGIAGLIIAAVLASVVNRHVLAITRIGDPGMRLSLLGAMVLLIAGVVAFRTWKDFDTQAHFVAAIAMFALVALATATNAWERRRSEGARWYFWLYAVIATLMVVSAAVMLPFESTWHHTDLILEMTEISLFAAAWLVRTAEHWNETV